MLAKILLVVLAIIGGWVILLHLIDYLRWSWRNR